MLLNKFNRTNFLNTVEVDSSLLEYDMLLNNWDLFKIIDAVKFSRILGNEVQRPDLLSQRIYGSTIYWWILCKVNHIDDVWNDMVIGDKIIIPSINDINKFYSAVKRRNRNV